MSQRRIDFDSWNRAAKGYDDVTQSAPSALDQVVSATTQPSACEADGPSTVDAAVSLMLTVFSEVMREGFIAPLREGLASEADALVDTGKDFRAAEDDHAAIAGAVERWY